MAQDAQNGVVTDRRGWATGFGGGTLQPMCAPVGRRLEAGGEAARTEGGSPWGGREEGEAG